MRRTLLLLTAAAALSLALLWCGDEADSAGGFTVAPADSIVLTLTVSDTTGDPCAAADSVVAKVRYQGNATPWQTVYLDSVGPGHYEKLIRADSISAGASLRGVYVAHIRAYGACGRSPHDHMAWRVGEDARVYGPIEVAIKTTHSGGTIVVGADVAIRDMAGTSVLAIGRTGADGYYKFWRPEPAASESLLVYLWHATTTWATPETVVVQSADVDITFDGTDHTPTIAADPDLQHVFGYQKWPGGGAGVMTPRAGITVAAKLERGYNAYVPSAVLSRYVFTTVTDSTGRWDLWVVPNSDITPAGTKYLFEIRDIPPERKLVAVPDTTVSLDYKDL